MPFLKNTKFLKGEKLILKKIVMRKITITVVLFFYILSVFGQSSDTEMEINQQVWIPFIKSFGTDNQELFKSVHSKDMVRVVRDQEEIFGYDYYFREIPDSLKKSWGKWEKKIELRFTQRISGDDKAFEVGYYSTTSTNSETGEKRKSIGKFHVLLKKEIGRWKIYLDADTSIDVTEADFERAMPIKE